MPKAKDNSTFRVPYGRNRTGLTERATLMLAPEQLAEVTAIQEKARAQSGAKVSQSDVVRGLIDYSIKRAGNCAKIVVH